MLAVFRGKIKTGRRTEAVGFSSHWRILGLEKFDLSVVCARARLRPAPSPGFLEISHHPRDAAALVNLGPWVGDGATQELQRSYQRELPRVLRASVASTP